MAKKTAPSSSVTREQLIENLNGSLLEIAMNVSLKKLLPGRVQA